MQNDFYGVYIDEFSNFNQVYHNNFLTNNGVGPNTYPNPVQAYDDGIGNIWDDGMVGNHWDDYLTPAGPYMIAGIAGAMDNFPSPGML